MTKILAKWEKQPGETVDVDVSYADFLHLRTDTILDNSKVTLEVPVGITLEHYELVAGDTSPDNAGAVVSIPKGVVKMWFSEGIDGETYKVTVKAITVGGREKHAEIIIVVKEV